MTTNTNTTTTVRRSHAACDHPTTKVARAACRRGAVNAAPNTVTFLNTGDSSAIEEAQRLIDAGYVIVNTKFDIATDEKVTGWNTGTVAFPVYKLTTEGTRPLYVKRGESVNLSKTYDVR